MKEDEINQNQPGIWCDPPGAMFKLKVDGDYRIETLTLRLHAIAMWSVRHNNMEMAGT